MKLINKILIIGLIFMMSSCSEVFDLDINDNPNAVSPEDASIEFLYNNAQIDFNRFYAGTWAYTSTASRMQAMITGFTYREAYQPTGFSALWTMAYANAMPDLNRVIEISDEQGFSVQGGSARVMKSYILTTLVDIFGDVPLSEAFLGAENVNPSTDAGADVYQAALDLLNEATDVLEREGPTVPFDNFYNGDATLWIKAANSLKIRLLNNRRLVDPGAGAAIAAIVAEGNFITEASEDLVWRYSSDRANFTDAARPDSRHPFYADSYEASDGDYMSNYYMWLLIGEKANITDPRTRWYFYRQDSDLTNDGTDVFDCVLTSDPFEDIPAGQFDHYTSIDPNLPFCVAAANGYFGRDHGNGGGIPPDGGVRTVYGLYPAGGSWDNNSVDFTQVDGTTGALGAGISPIMLSSYVSFIRAEAALTAGTGENARALLEEGVRASISKVMGTEVPSAELSAVVGTDPVTGQDILADVLIPTDSIVEAYVSTVLDIYDNSSDQLDVVMKEYYIAAWGNGVEAYNLYRRTGRPNNMPPLIDPNAASNAEFPRAGFYPANFVELNENAVQRELTEQVFWDNNPAGFIQ